MKNDKLIIKVNSLQKAFNDLSAFWSDLDSDTDDNLISSKKYPFKSSFDGRTIQVDAWCKDLIRLIQ